MNTGLNYKNFYDVLSNIRELFHSHGRIDDSNAKLDEIVKIIMLSYYHAMNGRRFSLALVKEYAQTEFNNEDSVAAGLIKLFDVASKETFFINNDGTSIFGTNPALAVQVTENDFAEKLLAEIEKIDFVNMLSQKKLADFDIINECFGHFVRDNFRNNKEDAQYMTPAEISTPILNMIFSDLAADGALNRDTMSQFKIMDPTCGVGTLLIESAKKYIELLKSESDDESIHYFLNNGVIGQDKVERMARFAKLNALFLGSNVSNITIGNSITGNSDIDKYRGQIDLIFTNPPFGAEYDSADLKENYYSIFSNIKKRVNSELLLVMKCIEMLKPNGYLAIVLPDSVFSAKGINVDIRNYLLEHCEIRAVVALPAVTFAQAGTRTKTSICYLRKKKSDSNSRIVMSISNDIGFIVKERVGIPVKISSGKNDLEFIAETYVTRMAKTDKTILSEAPSVTYIRKNELIDNLLNPGFYGATRFKTLETLMSEKTKGIEIYKLAELVDFVSLTRKSFMVDELTRHISVLHIGPNCIIDFNAVEKFLPISKGRECIYEDLIFSKINPRIPRMAVVPDYPLKLVCSNEFEILRAKKDISIYIICILLRSDFVTKQIAQLTSGTSSSHSRIKREQLTDIYIPYPVSKNAFNDLSKISEEIEMAFNSIYSADRLLTKQMSELEQILAIK